MTDLELAFALADLAAELSLRAFEDRSFQVERKPDNSLVTTADKAIESTLREMIGRERLADDIVGEEFGGEPTDSRCWYLDPIDGTASFVEGSNRWGTLIALAEGGLVTTAVVDVPMQNRRFWATRGQGAFADGDRLQVSTVGQLSNATVCDDYRRNIERGVPGHLLVQLAGQSQGVLPNDEYPAMAVARGRADVALGSEGGSWDYAPFVLLVEEAGGKMTDLDGQSRFDRLPILATNGLLHDECLGILRR